MVKQPTECKYNIDLTAVPRSLLICVSNLTTNTEVPSLISAIRNRSSSCLRIFPNFSFYRSTMVPVTIAIVLHSSSLTNLVRYFVPCSACSCLVNTALMFWIVLNSPLLDFATHVQPGAQQTPKPSCAAIR